MSKTAVLTFHALSLQNWDNFVELFGDNGACGGCWCMYFRLSKADFSAGKYSVNKSRIKEPVRSSRPTGILAFSEGSAIGWCLWLHAKISQGSKDRACTSESTISTSGRYRAFLSTGNTENKVCPWPCSKRRSNTPRRIRSKFPKLIRLCQPMGNCPTPSHITACIPRSKKLDSRSSTGRQRTARWSDTK